jgi:hemolysin-activating ACP:hemolysin acyltransferase
MRQSYLEVFNEPSARSREIATKLGFACQLMPKASSHAMRPMHHLDTLVMPAIRHDKIKFFFNDEGRVCGYVIWALVAEDVEDRFIRSGSMDLHVSEWNEGESLWIIDLLVPYGSLKYVLRHLRDKLFSDHDRVRYCRIKRQRRFIKEIERSDRLSFFKHKIFI